MITLYQRQLLDILEAFLWISGAILHIGAIVGVLRHDRRHAENMAALRALLDAERQPGPADAMATEALRQEEATAAAVIAIADAAAAYPLSGEWPEGITPYAVRHRACAWFLNPLPTGVRAYDVAVVIEKDGPGEARRTVLLTSYPDGIACIESSSPLTEPDAGVLTNVYGCRWTDVAERLGIRLRRRWEHTVA